MRSKATQKSGALKVFLVDFARPMLVTQVTQVIEVELKIHISFTELSDNTHREKRTPK